MNAVFKFADEVHLARSMDRGSGKMPTTALQHKSEICRSDDLGTAEILRGLLSCIFLSW